MGGWSGGIYTRFRNWVTDKANSINPQASLFDQEDDGFAAGLNNCITKDGLNKPSSAMDWNGQNLSGVLNLTVTGTLSAAGTIVLGSGASASSLTLGNATSNPPFNFLGTGLTLFSGPVEGGLTAKPQFILNSAGANFGLLQNDSTGVWSLAFGTSTTALGTPVLQWNSSGNAFARDAAGTLQAVGFLNLPQNLQNGSPYTLVLADSGKSIFTAVNLTIPANASVAYPLGTAITIITSSSSVTIAITSDTLTWAASGGTTGTRTLAAFSMATIIKTGATGWMISGPGLS